MKRFRPLTDEDALFFRRSDDKREAFKELQRRNQLRGGCPFAIPYFDTGRKSRKHIKSTRVSGRIHKTCTGQTRHYIDWILAQESDSPLLPSDFRML